MTDWATIASFATAAGTLVLAVATFSSVRSANRSARIAERSFMIGLRPSLAPSRLEDPPERIMFADRHWVNLKGGRAGVEFSEGVIYFAMLVRNVGNGMAYIESWLPIAGQRTSTDDWSPIDTFRPQTRSLWIAPGDVAFWQGALRDQTELSFDSIRQAVADGAVTIDVLYRDREGGQRTVSRFALVRREEDGDDEGCDWWVSLGSHHELDDG
ncbi:MAG: hypothetical protein ACRDWB_05350 [Acidimicrobiales bacterium]